MPKDDFFEGAGSPVVEVARVRRAHLLLQARRANARSRPLQ
jgi:hypothetical protein